MNIITQIPMDAALKVSKSLVLFICQRIMDRYVDMPNTQSMADFADSLDYLESYLAHLIHTEKETFNDPTGKMVQLELCVNTGEAEDDLLYVVFVGKFRGIPNGTLLLPRRVMLIQSDKAYKLYKSGLSVPVIPEVDITLERSVNLTVERLKYGNHVAQA